MSARIANKTRVIGPIRAWISANFGGMLLEDGRARLRH